LHLPKLRLQWLLPQSWLQALLRLHAAIWLNYACAARVTRFSPNWQSFTMSSFFKATKVDQMLGLLLSTIMGWATFWTGFSHTLLEPIYSYNISVVVG
jgi:hypothetical protein